MNYRIINVFFLVIIVLLVVINIISDNINKGVTNSKKVYFSKDLSMMLETGSNTGVYELTTRSNWPSDGYLFNSELSSCENGSSLSWDDDAKTVVMSGNVSDKCYVYFDKYNLAVINSITEEVTYNSIKVTVNATEGTKPISKYYYSSDGGVSYIESTSSNYIFSGLESGTSYNVKVYVVDTNGKISDAYTKSVTTSLLLTTYIKNQYIGIQGENGLYYHNGTITSGTTVIDANDGSYRYAGSNPNNYVCFGSDAEVCPSDNLYRIIGVFGDQVKLIKADYANSNLLGTNGLYKTYTYSASDLSSYKGNLSSINTYWLGDTTHYWKSSLLNTINLNKNYIAYLNSQNTKWADMITEALWKVVSEFVFGPMYEVYQNEIVSLTIDLDEEYRIYSSKIGLMYVSDYGYAASSTYWTYYGFGPCDKDYSEAVNDNWMYMGLDEWTITAIVDDIIEYSSNSFHGSNDAYYIGERGFVASSSAATGSAIRPCFYLASNVAIDGEHMGSSSDPFRLLQK